MVCHFLAATNWKLKPRKSKHSMQMADHEVGPQRGMELPSWLPGEPKNGGSQSSWVGTAGHDWWFWQLKSEGGCRETNGFISGLAKSRARSETPMMQPRFEQAWRLRWCGMLCCAVAKAFAAFLLDMILCLGSFGTIPWGHEVEGGFRFAGLAGVVV